MGEPSQGIDGIGEDSEKIELTRRRRSVKINVNDLASKAPGINDDEDAICRDKQNAEQQQFQIQRRPRRANRNKTAISEGGVEESGERINYNEDDDDIGDILEQEELSQSEDADYKSDGTVENDDEYDDELYSKNESKCSVCGEEQDVDDLLCCDNCPKVFHLNCLDPPLSRVPKGNWYCPDCQYVFSFNNIEKFLYMQPMEQKDVDYDAPDNCRWKLFAKWKEQSYRKCEWISEQKLLEAAKIYQGLKIKLQNYKRKFFENQRQKSTGSLSELAESSESIEPHYPSNGLVNGVDPEWLIIDRVIGKFKENNKVFYVVKWCELGYDQCTYEPLEELKKNPEDLHKVNQFETLETLQTRAKHRKNREKQQFLQIAQRSRQLQMESVQFNLDFNDDKSSFETSNQSNSNSNSNFVQNKPPRRSVRLQKAELNRWVKPETQNPMETEQSSENKGGELMTTQGNESPYRSANRTPPVENDEDENLSVNNQFINKSSKQDSRMDEGGDETQGDEGDSGVGVRRFRSTPTEFLVGGELHPYQLEGLNWLYFKWKQGENVILADEMGLGKTIQTIAFLSAISYDGVALPHVVVVPLSTMKNWERELEKWAPQLYVVPFAGNQDARQVIMQYELFADTRRKRRLGTVRFDILLCSYETLMLESSTLKQIQYACLVVDEGHRLKNQHSKLFSELGLFKSKHMVLLTGTPLQNNIGELFQLLLFLDRDKFGAVQAMYEEQFKEIQHEEQVSKLHGLLSPHLLRRMKKDVLKQLPPKKEQMVRVDMSQIQRQYYKSILEKNFVMLADNSLGRKRATSLRNVLIELRKCVNHPLLVGQQQLVAEDFLNTDVKTLISQSGKLELVDRMCTMLKTKGHRVLIYSQFVKTLDLLEEWLLGRGWGYTRIDGSLQGSERQHRIDNFNRHQEHYFVFLLSTRAGGLGINLATADTVIIYDSDWNPHNDLQAMARAHRMGQKKPVMVYRLVTRKSVEEKMMQQAKQKLMLEHLVVQKIARNKQDQQLKQDELDQVIRYGAEDLFKETTEDQNADNDQINNTGDAQKIDNLHGRIVYSDEDIEKLIDRSDLENMKPVDLDEEEDEDNDDFMNAFRVANFEIKEDDAKDVPVENVNEDNKKKDNNADNMEFWSNVLGQNMEQHLFQQQLQETEKMAKMGRGKRERKQVTYYEKDPDLDADDDNTTPEKNKDNKKQKVLGQLEAEDEEFKMDVDDMADVDEDLFDEDFIQQETGVKRALHKGFLTNSVSVAQVGQGIKRQKGPEGQALTEPYLQMGADPVALNVSPPASLPPLKEGVGEEMKIYSLTYSERSRFMNLLLRFGVRPTAGVQSGFSRFDWHYMQPSFPQKPYEVLQAYGWQLLSWVQLLSDKRADYVPEGIPVGMFLMSHQPREVLERIGLFGIVMQTIERLKNVPESKVRLYPEGTLVGKKQPLYWTHQHDHQLLIGVFKHGYSRWRDILNDDVLGLKDPVRKEIGLDPDYDAIKPEPSNEETKNISTKKYQETEWVKMRVHDLVRVLQKVLANKTSPVIQKSVNNQQAVTIKQQSNSSDLQNKTLGYTFVQPNQPVLIHKGPNTQSQVNVVGSGNNAQFEQLKRNCLNSLNQTFVEIKECEQYTRKEVQSALKILKGQKDMQVMDEVGKVFQQSVSSVGKNSEKMKKLLENQIQQLRAVLQQQQQQSQIQQQGARGDYKQQALHAEASVVQHARQQQLSHQHPTPNIVYSLPQNIQGSNKTGTDKSQVENGIPPLIVNIKGSGLVPVAGPMSATQQGNVQSLMQNVNSTQNAPPIGTIKGISPLAIASNQAVPTVLVSQGIDGVKEPIKQQQLPQQQFVIRVSNPPSTAHTQNVASQNSSLQYQQIQNVGVVGTQNMKTIKMQKQQNVENAGTQDVKMVSAQKWQHQNTQNVGTAGINGAQIVNAYKQLHQNAENVVNVNIENTSTDVQQQLLLQKNADIKLQSHQSAQNVGSKDVQMQVKQQKSHPNAPNVDTIQYHENQLNILQNSQLDKSTQLIQFQQEKISSDEQNQRSCQEVVLISQQQQEDLDVPHIQNAFVDLTDSPIQKHDENKNT